MERYYKYIRRTFSSLLTLALTFVLTSSLLSCDNSDNIGDLYGMWKLDQMEYNGTSYAPNDLFLCFQSQYVDARKSNETVHGSDNAFGHYVNKGTTMSMTFYYDEDIKPSSPASDPHNPAEFLKDFMFFDDGTPLTEEEQKLNISPVHLHFDVVKMTSSEIILKNDEGRWVFTKY